MKRRIDKLFAHIGQQTVFYGFVFAGMGLILWYHLGTLTPGFSAPELMARSAASSGKEIVANPLFLPHKLLQYLLISLGHTGAFWMRFVSTLFAGLIVVAFYRILRTWYTARVALFSSFLLLSSAWFLHFARLATPQILLGSSIGLLWAGLRLRGNEPRHSTVLLSFAIVLYCLYIPGLIWFIAPLIVWRHKIIFRELRRIHKGMLSLMILAFLFCITPLVYSFTQNTQILLDWLYVPHTIQLSTIISNSWGLPIWLLLRAPVNYAYWLGRVPYLDIFSVVMLALGVFVSIHNLILDRVRTIFGMLIIGIVLTILNGPLALMLIIPIIFVLIASGIALLLQQWFTVFPKNPLARTVGVIMVLSVVLIAGLYNLKAYFVAWPNNIETIQSFQEKG